MPLLIEQDRLDFALQVDRLCSQGLDLIEVARSIEPDLTGDGLRYRLRKQGFDLRKGRVRLGITGEPISELLTQGVIAGDRPQAAAGSASLELTTCGGVP